MYHIFLNYISYSSTGMFWQCSMQSHSWSGVCKVMFYITMTTTYQTQLRYVLTMFYIITYSTCYIAHQAYVWQCSTQSHTQGSFCVCAQPMRDGVTMQHCSSLAGCINKTIPACNIPDQPCSGAFTESHISYSRHVKLWWCSTQSHTQHST